MQTLIHFLLFFAVNAFASPATSTGIEIPTKVNKIYSYQCQLRFFEGEGVSQHEVSCPAHQRLGFLTANYSYQLFANDQENNFAKKARELRYPESVCGLNNVPRASCESGQRLNFGLATERSKEFPLGVMLQAAPNDSSWGPDTSLYGFAALPGRDGQCPAPLVEARNFLAQPASVIDPLPSNFINSNNHLSNRVLATVDAWPKNFEVWRHSADRGCNETGHCPWPTGGAEMQQSVPYATLHQKICVIPTTQIPLEN